MKAGICEKHYPKPFQKYSTYQDGFIPLYKRSKPGEGGFTTQTWCRYKNEMVEIDNRNIVPYNRYLLAKYQCHINVEVVASIQVTKYLFKYLHKGQDRVIVGTGSMDNDEIEMYINASYHSDTNSCWRIFQYSMSAMHPPVTSLPLHLPDEQMVYIHPGQTLLDAAMRQEITMLTAFFQLNEEDPDANGILYPDILKSYTYVQSTKSFRRRTRNLSILDDGDSKSDAIGRIPIIALNAAHKELFYLRVLLYNVPGPTGFEDLKTLESGEVCRTFHESAIKRGLCADGKEAENAFKEGFQMAFKDGVRRLFVEIIMFCESAEPRKLYDDYIEELCEDYKKEAGVLVADEAMKQRALMHIQRLLESHNKTLEQFGLPKLDDHLVKSLQRKDIEEELSYCNGNLEKSANEKKSMMNKEQLSIVNEVLTSVDTGSGDIISIDAPAGTGKTFVLCTILEILRAKYKIALAMATTGISTTLLPGM